MMEKSESKKSERIWAKVHNLGKREEEPSGEVDKPIAEASYTQPRQGKHLKKEARNIFHGSPYTNI